MEWLLYFVIFAFGYTTSKALYFLRSTKLSLRMLRASHLIYLSVMIKALENLSYSREIMLEHMLRTEKNAPQITSFELRFDTDVKALKERSIRSLREEHPKFFQTAIEFDDWDSSMEYLMKHKEIILEFWMRE